MGRLLLRAQVDCFKRLLFGLLGWLKRLERNTNDASIKLQLSQAVAAVRDFLKGSLRQLLGRGATCGIAFSGGGIRAAASVRSTLPVLCVIVD